jgi:hypothetical protein
VTKESNYVKLCACAVALKNVRYNVSVALGLDAMDYEVVKTAAAVRINVSCLCSSMREVMRNRKLTWFGLKRIIVASHCTEVSFHHV